MGIETIIITGVAGLIGGTASYIFEKSNRPDLAIVADRYTKLVLFLGVGFVGYQLYSIGLVFL